MKSYEVVPTTPFTIEVKVTPLVVVALFRILVVLLATRALGFMYETTPVTGSIIITLLVATPVFNPERFNPPDILVVDKLELDVTFKLVVLVVLAVKFCEIVVDAVILSANKFVKYPDIEVNRSEYQLVEVPFVMIAFCEKRLVVVEFVKLELVAVIELKIGLSESV
jgi:hypothetical protein